MVLGHIWKKYACAEGGAHLPIAQALRLPEPTKKNKSEGGQRTGAKRRDTALRFGFFGWLRQAGINALCSTSGGDGVVVKFMLILNSVE